MAWLQLIVLEDAEAALDTLKAGAKIYKKNLTIGEIVSRLESSTPVFAEDRIWPQWDVTAASGPRMSSKMAASFQRFPGVTRILVATPLVTMHADLISLIDVVTATAREPKDVVAISESVLAIAQGRAIPLELVDPGPLARILRRFVGSEGPLHSPEGMQGAVAEAGVGRILAAALLGGAARVAGIKGVFYKVTGPNCAMIDDVAACMPPFDHHLILGPSNPRGFAEHASEKLGCRVCVVDANNKTGAWVVGASRGVDEDAIESILSDSPAGNEDEQTPLVLIKGLD